ncbi:nuclear transport factor 2 family protein [Rhodococcus spelaei]|uniref:Nuclear transport factor 2 family protein n=1 Tax=Rhodococcus spelaei TaxID=2546320 RepID=A0A541B7V2_9NOCA|nr:nuclear transport factor 2 family protein [Rhodococcus spelaei]TQF68394.1 nuclear transport factor 2 family protein [Rhodococcus spelaei]
MINRKLLIAAGAVVVALGSAACSSDDSSDSAASATTSAAATAAAPSAEVLGATLTTFFDPAVAVPEKVAVVQDGAKQTAVLEQFNGVLKGYPLTAQVTKVTPVDADTVTATTTITGPHGGAPVEVNFDQVDGKWVVSQDAVCTIFSMGKLTCVQ